MLRNGREPSWRAFIVGGWLAFIRWLEGPTATRVAAIGLWCSVALPGLLLMTGLLGIAGLDVPFVSATVNGETVAVSDLLRPLGATALGVVYVTGTRVLRRPWRVLHVADGASRSRRLWGLCYSLLLGIVASTLTAKLTLYALLS